MSKKEKWFILGGVLLFLIICFTDPVRKYIDQRSCLDRFNEFYGVEGLTPQELSPMLAEYLSENIHLGMNQQEVGHALVGLEYSSGTDTPAGLVYFPRCPARLYFSFRSEDFYEFVYSDEGYLLDIHEFIPY